MPRVTRTAWRSTASTVDYASNQAYSVLFHYRDTTSPSIEADHRGER